MSRGVLKSSIELLCVSAVVLTLMSCGGGTTSTPTPAAKTGTITTTMSDPPSCAIDNVYVTVTKVTANISTTAEESDSGWVTLVDFTSNPKQVDLLHLAGSGACVLSQTLGSTSGLPPGKYGQIRLYLLANNAASGPSPNACGSGGFNCAMDGGAMQILELSSEAQTGLKIPPGQIAGGGLDLAEGQSADINIDFDACTSILRQGNGKLRLKPTLRAGVVSVTNNSLSGKVVDASNSNAPIGGALVLLEQPDASDATIDRVVRSTTTGADGAFIICPLESTNPFDVVVTAWTTPSLGADVTYNATVAFNVPVGTDLNPIPLVPEGTTPPTLPATLTGQVTSAGSGGAIAADVTLSAMQQATPDGGATKMLTVPIFGALMQPPTFTTTATPDPAVPACPAGTNCFNYSIMVPASNPKVGTFSSGAITYGDPAPAPVNYNLNFVAGSCTAVAPSATVGPTVVTPGTAANVSTVVAFTGCT